MSNILKQSDTNYIVCNTDYTAEIADNPIKTFQGEIDEMTELKFIHYTYQELIDIRNGDLSKIKKAQGVNKNFDLHYKKEMTYDHYCEHYCDEELEGLQPVFIYDYANSKYQTNGYKNYDKNVNIFVGLHFIALLCG